MSSPTPKYTNLYDSDKIENYPSLRIVREYKKRGGTYSGKKPKWFDRKRTRVESYVKTVITVQYSSPEQSTNANSGTPITLSELIQIATFSYWFRNKKIGAIW